MLLSKQDYARRCGRSKPSVSRWIGLGMPVTADGKIDVAAADAWRAARLDPGHDRRDVTAPAEPGGLFDAGVPARRSDLQEARARVTARQAQLLEAKLDALEKRTVERAAVERAVFGRARFERDAWQAWPARVAASLAVRLGTDVEPTRLALAEAVREQLTTLAATPFELEAA